MVSFSISNTKKYMAAPAMIRISVERMEGLKKRFKKVNEIIITNHAIKYLMDSLRMDSKGTSFLISNN